MVTVALMLASVARAEDDARTKQLRLLCAQLSGDFTDPGGAAAFRRCMTQDPLNEIRRDNNIAAVAPDRPNAAPPAGHGRNTRHSQADGVHRFEAAEANLLFAIDKDGKLWRWTVDTKDARMVDQDVAAVQAIDGHAFVQHTDGTLWRTRLDGSERIRIDQAVAAFQAINASLVYVLTTNGTLWRETGDAGKRQEVDHTVTSFQAVDASLVFVLAADGQLWRETGTAQSRTFVAKDIAAYQYIAGGDTTYVLAADGTLWRKGPKGEPEQVDRSVAAFRAADMHLAYVLGRDGRLWQELGGRDQAVLVDRDVLVTLGNAAFQIRDPSHIYLIGNDYKLWSETMPPGR
jgi:hypothetical protein